MVELFIMVILIIFFGLFVVMALPMKDTADQLNQQDKPNNQNKVA